MIHRTHACKIALKWSGRKRATRRTNAPKSVRRNKEKEAIAGTRHPVRLSKR